MPGKNKTTFKIKDLSGQRFGKLTVLNERRFVRNHLQWLCVCDCGILKYIRGDAIQKTTKSCGCLQKETALRLNRCLKYPDGEKPFNDVFYNYRARASRKKLDFKLTKAEFKDLTQKNCYYCESIPKNKYINPRFSSDFFIYNGIDRMDNTKGYVLANCVPCCIKCNNAKSDMSYNEFLEWIILVYNKFGSKFL